MSKRKNMWRYIPEVFNWDQWLLINKKTGEWDHSDAQKNIQTNPTKAMEDLTSAVEGCIKKFKTNPSCPALEACLSLCNEANLVGLNVDDLSCRARSEWNLHRQAKSIGRQENQ